MPDPSERANAEPVDIREALEPDGGRHSLHDGTRRTDVYYWLDPQSGAALYHTGAYDDEANPFFGTVDDAETFLERQAETAADPDRYEGLSLYKARTKKVADATDVLTDQAGIDDFAPDGGHQIDRSPASPVWFWYDPARDYIVQDEVDPYVVRGLFDTRGDAVRFLTWYADRYNVADTGHYELYSATLEFEGYGLPDVDAGPAEEPSSPASLEQADLDVFRPGHESSGSKNNGE